jgi:hypothetical protein
MTPIAEMVKALLEKGVPHDAILVAIEGAERAMLANTPVVSPQMSADVSADRRREKDRLRKQEIRRNPQMSADNPQMSNSCINKEDTKKDSKRRGVRLSADWLPTSDGHSFALREGFSVSEVDREVQKFRDYWIARPGVGGTKLDWDATWRQWVRKGAESAGKTPAPTANGASPDAGVDWDKTAALYAKTGHWSRWAGPAPDHNGCRCPREVLEKHGIAV